MLFHNRQRFSRTKFCDPIIQNISHTFHLICKRCSRIAIRQTTFGADGNQLYSFALDEIQSLGDVGDAVEPHLASVWLRQLLARDDLEQQHQFQAVAEVFLDHFDLRVHLAQVRIAPRRKRLQPQHAGHTSNHSVF